MLCSVYSGLASLKDGLDPLPQASNLLLLAAPCIRTAIAYGPQQSLHAQSASYFQVNVEYSRELSSSNAKVEAEAETIIGRRVHALSFHAYARLLALVGP